MRINKFLIISALFLGLFVACNKSELDVKNPNVPTPASAATEPGIKALAQGAIYRTGFLLSTEAKDNNSKFYDGVFGHFWSGVIGFHEMLGDNIGIEAANAFLNQLACPDAVVLDDGTTALNPNSPKTQYELIRGINDNANQGGNPLFHEWYYMYSLNNGANTILDVVKNVKFGTAGDVKLKTYQAWAYFWKGFAYSHIGSMYYAGLINNTPNTTNGNFVTKEQIIAESNANFDKAAALLGGLTAGGDYDDIIGSLIPSFCQTGKGGILSPAEWIRNINTMKARNILANTPVASMSAAQWGTIATLTAAGVKSTDKVFTGRSNEGNDIWSTTGGTVAAKSTNAKPGGNTYKISERLIQDFKTGDKRLANNFPTGTAWIGNSDRGNAFNTRYTLISGGTGVAGAVTISNITTAGAAEIYLAGSYEENALMQAEAKIYTNDIAGAMPIIDAVRTFQGAGLPATSTTLNATDAKEELRKERRSALPFRGLAFYDARRWGIIEKSGSGRANCVVVDKTGKVNTKATIKYNYLDYWDVPANELAYNPAAAGSAPVVNPKK
jgi:starch-binding outer membrane protein, SusD/RagB family